MPVSVVLTFIGDDRPGLVESVSEVLEAHGANWEQSRMASLAGKFAGILLASAPSARAADLKAALESLSSEGLKLTVQHSAEPIAAVAHRTLLIEVVGQDHPGIVHEVSSAIASHGINVDELVTEVEHASMAGGDLFKARAKLHVPLEVDEDDLRDTLESLANEIMVDINLDALEDG